MNYQWQPSTGPTAYYDSTASQSPLTVRNRLEDGVPVGTVASRVQFLQNLAKSSASRAPSSTTTPSIGKRRREDSRIGFGRRINSRFGHPASRSSNPFEEAPETSHSFLGLNIARTNHEQEHASSDPRLKFVRSPGINGLIQPQGLTARVQYDAASPFAALPTIKSGSTLHLSREYSGLEMDMSKEADTSGKKTYSMAQTSIFPGPANDGPRSISYHREVKPRMDDTLNSEKSFLTTSTVRRQSVRDLFDHYGIEKPAGLASEEETPRGQVDRVTSVTSHRFCHVCSWVNSASAKKCQRCSDFLCLECRARSPVPASAEPNMIESPPINFNKDCPKSKAPKKENTPVEVDPTTTKPVRPGPTPFQNATQDRRVRKMSSPPIKFPEFHIESRNTSSETPQKSELPEPSKVPDLLTGSRRTTRVKNSPFVLADSRNKCLRLFAVEERLKKAHGPLVHQLNQHILHSSHTSGSGECDSPTCRATHDAYKPYRHSSICSRPNRRIADETDIGYHADTSHIEELEHSHSHSYTYPSRPRSGSSHVAKSSSRISQRTELTPVSECAESEFIECHGYPRTGHARHGSISTSGMIGEFQHCHDDCECTACQRTHHNVRCCTNKAHRSLAHHHDSYKLSAYAPKPLECLTSPLPRYGKPSPLYSPARTESTVVPMTKKSTPKSTNPSPSRRSTLEKRPNISRSKQSSLFKDKMKPQTPLAPVPPPPPPPLPNFERKTTAAASSRSMPHRTTADAALKIQPVSELLPLFNKRSSLPPPSYDESSVKKSRKETLIKELPITTENKPHKHASVRRESCTVPSRSNVISKDMKARAPSVGVPSRKDWNAPAGSRRDTERLPTLRQLKEHNSVSQLNQRLLEQQEELRQIRKECDEKSEALSEEGGRQTRQQPVEKNISSPLLDRMLSPVSSRGSGSGIKNWLKSKLVDKKPSPACENDNFLVSEEHHLSDDEVSEEEDESRRVEDHKLSDDEICEDPDEGFSLAKIVSGIWIEPSRNGEEEHECVWKRRFLDEDENENESRERREVRDQEENMLIQDITVIVHWKDRKDLVIKADLRNGGQVRTEGN